MRYFLQKFIEDAQSSPRAFHVLEIKYGISVARDNMQGAESQQCAPKPSNVMGDIINAGKEHFRYPPIKKAALLGFDDAFAGNYKRIEIPNNINFYEHQQPNRDGINKKSHAQSAPAKKRKHQKKRHHNQKKRHHDFPKQRWEVTAGH